MASPSFRQSHGGVQIAYGEDHVLTPLEDYVELLDRISARVPKNKPQFSSRVGLARVALLAGVLGIVFGIHALRWVK